MKQKNKYEDDDDYNDHPDDYSDQWSDDRGRMPECDLDCEYNANVEDNYADRTNDEDVDECCVHESWVPTYDVNHNYNEDRYIGDDAHGHAMW